MIDFEQWYEKEGYGLAFGSNEYSDCYFGARESWNYQQTKIDELQARVDKVVHILTYTNHASTQLCNELRDILKGNKDEN